MSRSKALKLNMIAGLLSEFVVLLSGLILPRLMLLYFGSSNNGLVSSISQFLGFSAILRAGIGGATRAALYKPLAEGDYKSLNGIMAATNQHMRKIGAIVGTAIIGLSFVYPIFVRGQYNWFYAASMVLIIGTGTFFDNFIGVKYKILLQADQKFYIQIGASTVTSVISTLISVILILSGATIHLTRVAISIVALINPLVLSIYVRKNYDINWSYKPNFNAIKQRWDAFFHQVASIVNQNVDLTLLTIFVSLKEVSVYTVHFMVVNNIGKVVNSCVIGINSTFGNIIAKDEDENLKTTFYFIEWLMFSICIIMFSVTAVMLPGFITLYTSSITDVNYLRPVLAVLMVVVSMVSSTRIPYQMLVEATGRFRETRNGAIWEVIINVLVSIILIYRFGIIGVIIGTLIAGFIRTIEYAFFCMKKILHSNPWHILRHYLLLFTTFTVCYYLGNCVLIIDVISYVSWAANAMIVTATSIIITAIVSLIFYRQQVKYLIARIVANRRRGRPA